MEKAVTMLDKNPTEETETGGGESFQSIFAELRLK